MPGIRSFLNATLRVVDLFTRVRCEIASMTSPCYCCLFVRVPLHVRGNSVTVLIIRDFNFLNR